MKAVFQKGHIRILDYNLLMWSCCFIQKYLKFISKIPKMQLVWTKFSNKKVPFQSLSTKGLLIPLSYTNICIHTPCMYFIPNGSNLVMVFLRLSSLEFVIPDGLPLTSSSALKRQLMSWRAHFEESLCNFAACSFSLSVLWPKISTWFYMNTSHHKHIDTNI